MVASERRYKTKGILAERRRYGTFEFASGASKKDSDFIKLKKKSTTKNNIYY